MHLSMHNWMRAEQIGTTIRRLAKYGFDAIEIEGEPEKLQKVRAKLDGAQPLGYSLCGRVIEVAPDVTDLRRLPGIGPARAAAIVRDRRERGPFRTLEDLERIPGLGRSTVSRLAPMLTLSTRPAEVPCPVPLFRRR